MWNTTMQSLSICKNTSKRKNTISGYYSWWIVKGWSLSPCAAVSVDHFESRLKGQTNDSFGKTSSDQYVGGYIFVDHMSGYIHVEQQLGFSTTKSIRAVINFDKLCLDNGTLIQKFLADNGSFKAKDFVNHIRNKNQRI